MKKLLGFLFLVVSLAMPSTALASGGSSGGVAGPCGTITSVSVTPTATLTSPITFKGSIKNCSQYIQRYWIDFSEPARPTSGGLNMPVTPCTISYRLMLNTYVSSGSGLGFSGTTYLTPTTTPVGCLGTHTVKVALKSRTDGRLLDTKYVSFTVTQ